MRRLLVSFALLVSLAAGAQPAAAAGIDRADFRYQRPRVAGPGGEPVLIEPDGPLFEHSLPGFADLRIADARGRQVPWRHTRFGRVAAPEAVPVLNSGRQGRFAVALLDLGARRTIRDRLVLDIPNRGFVGRAVVLGADGRDGPFTRLSATGIYDVRGAQPSRSTVAVFPPSDFRFLLVRATGVSRIAGAGVSGARERPRLLRRTARSVSLRQNGTRTIVTLDLGFRNVPVDELRIAAETGRYERPITIFGTNPQRRFVPLTAARIFRFPGSGSAPIPVGARSRYIRVEIDNGDDTPLGGIEVSAWSRSRALLVEGGHPLPYTVHYGSPRASAPIYDFARLPAGAVGVERSVHGRLGPERGTAAFEPPPDTRSFTARNPGVVTAALALSALALGAVGLLALRGRR
ncbi:MAG TPA: hypothetical protein VFW48_07295 [Solirubrobacterales bacterium]|nr:hypothetical protein [Solirubrobacterales bacterium]